MTAYHGGKQRLGKDISRIIHEKSLEIADDQEFKIKGYCEPFCGMLGVYNHIPEKFGKKLTYKAGDMNKSVIMMWKKAKNGWKPPVKITTKGEFMKLKAKDDSALKGFVGNVQSFRGIFFGGYYTHPLSRIRHSSERIEQIARKMKNVEFTDGCYTRYSKLKNYVIYCDPPYSQTQHHYYKSTSPKRTKSKSPTKRENIDFDTNAFWEWCEKMSENNIVFISEYKKPRYVKAKKVWSKDKEKLYLMD